MIGRDEVIPYLHFLWVGRLFEVSLMGFDNICDGEPRVREKATAVPSCVSKTLEGGRTQAVLPSVPRPLLGAVELMMPLVTPLPGGPRWVSEMSILCLRPSRGRHPVIRRPGQSCCRNAERSKNCPAVCPTWPGLSRKEQTSRDCKQLGLSRDREVPLFRECGEGRWQGTNSAG